MKFKALHTTLVVLSLVVAPTVGAAAPVQTPLTDPAAESIEAGVGASWGSRIPLFVAAVGAIAAGIASGVSGDDTPNSP